MTSPEAGEIEEQHEREHRDHHSYALGLVAVAEVLGYGAATEAVPRRGDEAHGDQHAEVHAGRIKDVAPLRRQAQLVSEPGAAEERRPARGGGGKREGEEDRPVGSACGRKIVGVLDLSLADDADRQHAADVDDQEDPGPRDQIHERPSLFSSWSRPPGPDRKWGGCPPMRWISCCAPWYENLRFCLVLRPQSHEYRADRRWRARHKFQSYRAGSRKRGGIVTTGGSSDRWQCWKKRAFSSPARGAA